LARVGNIRLAPARSVKNAPTVVRPANHVGYGGISSVTSSRSSRTRVATSASTNAAMYRSSSARSAVPSGSVTPLLDRVGLGQLGPGPLERAVDRGGRGVQQFGHLRRRPGRHVAQDQHRPLPRRKVPPGGDQREPDPGPGRDHGGRVGGQQRVGERLQPRQFLPRRAQRVAGVGTRADQAGGSGRPAPGRM
jgi:hypothetical protein